MESISASPFGERGFKLKLLILHNYFSVSVLGTAQDTSSPVALATRVGGPRTSLGPTVASAGGGFGVMDRRSRSPMKKPEIKRRAVSVNRRRRTSVDDGRQVTHAFSKY